MSSAVVATRAQNHAFASNENPDSARSRVHDALLACGFLASLLYVANDVICSFVWTDYSAYAQTISELSAIGAPSRFVWVPIGIVDALLVLAFGIGVWQSAVDDRRLRVTACLLIAMGAVVYWPPMHLRGIAPTLTDVLHVMTTAVFSIEIMLAIAFASTTLGRRFRLYSFVTLGILLVSGSVTFFYAPRLVANLPTPGMGVFERIDLGAYLLWVAVLSILLRSRARDARVSG